MAAHNDLGRLAERMAAGLLERNGWTILERNWRWHRIEIDLIARRGALVAFVEVKARRSARAGHPLEAIDHRKRQRLQAAAGTWLAQHGGAGDDCRFDAIWLLRGPRGVRLEHVEDAWRL